jgi:hypothetical protein
MRQVTVPLPELAAIAATRAIGGIGLGLVLGGLASERRGRKAGWLLLGIGIGSTIPLLFDVVRNNPELMCEEPRDDPKA